MGKQLFEELDSEEYDIYLIKVIRCDKYIPNTTSGTRNKTTYNYSFLVPIRK